MHRQILEACLPWLLLLAASFAGLRLVVRLSGARLQWGRMKQIHSCQAGSVQTLSFVLTLPLFVLIVLFIIQISQLMVGITVVHYAAYAAARAASVWLPADLGPGNERPNQVARTPFYPDGTPNGGPWRVDYPQQSDGSSRQTAEWKYNKIWTAAALACAPIAPSRRLYNVPTNDPLLATVKSMYALSVPTAGRNPQIPQRIDNKLTYSLWNTQVRIEGLNRDSQPGPTYNPWPYYEVIDPQTRLPVPVMWNPNELGWEDPLTVTVQHRFALLPGPARWLATQVTNPNGTPDYTSQRISVLSGSLNEKVHATVLTARATMSNEGFKSVISYVQPAN